MKFSIKILLIFLVLGCSSNSDDETANPDNNNPQSCNAPANVAASQITANSANINWTFSGSASFQIEYGSANFNQGEGQVITASGNSQSIINLNPNTSYDVYIRTNCGNSNFSNWIGPISLTTASLPPSIPVPYLMTNIDADTKLLKWYAIPEATSYTIEYGIAGFPIGNGQIINTPENSALIDYITVIGTQELYLKANYPNNQSSDYVGPLSFFTNGSDCGATSLSAIPFEQPNGILLNWGATWNGNTSPNSWRIEYGVSGFELGSGTVAITPDQIAAFTLEDLEYATDYDIYVKGNCNNGGESIHTGFVTYSTLAECPAPSPFQVSFVSSTLITLTCYSIFAESWDVIYGEVGFDISDGTVFNTTDATPTIEGLQPNTTYDIYARSYCENGQISEIIGPLQVTTDN